ncbi:TonB-dependent receptor [Sphingomonas sp. MG17]|uniref:TonB-dependent receptor n=1 Tax=Sphingomonas tagetis TaxID=2949092 RepID=A0A9X2KLM5_9SPHN|nr:TonB-dependent receptor [Sphingomonas tagetis]MCP3730556.1 TonB-dependent receptor [Sphingomonas tagetis]
MMRTRATRFSLAALAGTALATSLPALAQTAAETRGDGEIVVTARKSDERIQDVPVSITAVSGETLRDRGANELQDVLRSVPGLSNQNAERGLSRYTIRGLSTYASSPTTGLYLDDVSLVTISTTFSGGFDPVFFDMQRIEVLKGPQGTLYGGSAMGGAIKYVSNRPDVNRFGVEAAIGVAAVEHGSPSYNGEVVVNAPIVEGSLAFRGGFFYRHDGGYIDAVPGLIQTSSKSSAPFPTYVPLQRDALSTRSAKDINYGDTYALRASLEWQPDESWSIRPQIFFQDSKFADNGHFFINRPDFQAAHRFAQPNKDRAAIYSLNIDKDFGGVRLTSLTARFDRQFDYVRDYSFFIGGLVAPLYALTSYNLSDSTVSTFSQEVRLASNTPDSRLRWVIGGYYSNQDDNLYQAVDTPGAAALLGANRLYFGDTTTKTKQYAAFGEASFELIDGLEVTAGVRLFKVEQRVDALISGPLAGVGGGVINGRISKEDGVNPKVGLSYKVTSDNLIFASAAKGFRPGGANRYAISTSVCGAALAALGRTSAPDAFESDNLWTYEVGTKNLFGNGKVMLNAAGYLTKWKKIQQSIGLACGFGFTDNVGSAEIKGFEVEGRVEPVAGFEIGGTAAYTTAKVTEAAPGTGVVVGQGLPNVPEWTATAYAGYSMAISNGWRVDLRGEYQYQSRALWAINPTRTITYSNGVTATGPNPSQYRAPYDVVNAFVTIGNDDTSVRLYARNLFDVRPYLDLDLTTGVDRALTIRPRTIGVELRQSF